MGVGRMGGRLVEQQPVILGPDQFVLARLAFAIN